MELTTSRVILFAFIVVFCNGINPTTILNLGGSYDKTLSGHGYEVLKVKTLEHCHRICLYSPKCLSVNWNVKTKYCQLNSEAVGTEAPLMMSWGELYVPAQSSNLKNHACTSSPCMFGEVCIPVASAADLVCLHPDEQVSTTTESPTPTKMPVTTRTVTPRMTKTATTAQDCSRYSDSFERFRGYVVWGYNEEHFSRVRSVSTCQKYCVQNKEITCKSYEYYYQEQWCFLQSIVKADAISKWTADPGGDYFERQCDVTP